MLPGMKGLTKPLEPATCPPGAREASAAGARAAIANTRARARRLRWRAGGAEQE